MPPLPSRPPVRILAFDDSGGVRAFAQIEIINSMMEGIKNYEVGAAAAANRPELTEAQLDQIIRPCNRFDLIVGSGTGGILAVLFGRFGLTPAEAKVAYKQIGDEVYTKPQWRVLHTMKYSEDLLRDVIVRQTKQYLPGESGNGDGSKVTFRPANSKVTDTGCRTAVLALPVYNISSARVIRSYQNYKSSDSELSQATIWQVVRATTASYGLFPEIVLGGDFGPGERLRGPEHGFSNPARVAQDEVYPAFNLKPGRNSLASGNRASRNANTNTESANIACLISVGAGKRPVLPMAETGVTAALWAAWALLWRQTPDALQVLQNMATDCESVHESLQADVSLRTRYFRFNQEPGQINLDAKGNPDFRTDDWSDKNVDSIVKAARIYMEDNGSLLQDLITQKPPEYGA